MKPAAPVTNAFTCVSFPTRRTLFQSRRRQRPWIVQPKGQTPRSLATSRCPEKCRKGCRYAVSQQAGSSVRREFGNAEPLTTCKHELAIHKIADCYGRCEASKEGNMRLDAQCVQHDYCAEVNCGRQSASGDKSCKAEAYCFLPMKRYGCAGVNRDGQILPNWRIHAPFGTSVCCTRSKFDDIIFLIVDGGNCRVGG